VIVVCSIDKAREPGEPPTPALVTRRMLKTGEPTPPGAVWIDMIEPTSEEDEREQRFLGCPIPWRSAS
jgi:hypothetical protein